MTDVAVAGREGPITYASTTRRAFGRFGLVVAILGLVAAVGGPYVAEALKPPPRKLSEALAEAGDKVVGRVLDRVRGKPPAARPPAPPPPTPWEWYFSAAGTALGLIGALSGTVGWIRREDHRLAGAAIAVGSLALAWTYIVTALILAPVIVILIVLFG